MTMPEINEAFNKQTPVVYRGMRYVRISRIIKAKDLPGAEGRYLVRLDDKNGHSFLEVPIEGVEHE